MKHLLAHLCLSFFYVSLFHTNARSECWNGCSYQCWNAQLFNISSPSNFLIDMVEKKIVLTANDSVCHISLDLDRVYNVQDVTPSAATIVRCTGVPNWENEEKCHNFHHVLLLPSPSGHMTVGDSATPINNTVLECGSNAFDPQCTYRMRSNLTSVSTAEGMAYIPQDAGSTKTISLWLSTGRLVVAATPLSQRYGIVVSGRPYNGSVQVGTKAEWFDRSVQFVSMYEIDDYIYTFFREDPDETSHNVIYSRVSRICKGDNGVPPENPDNYNVFTTFLKARMTCVSGGSNGDIPYHYDELQDTFLVEDNDGKRSLFAVYTSPKNGPEGSAVCFYTFGTTTNSYDLETVFEGDYLKETGQNKYESVSNPTPLNCTANRDLQEADSLHLMKFTVRQASGDKLHAKLTGYTLQKILVTSVVALDGTHHDVMFLAGQKGGAAGTNVLLKTIYDSAQQKHHTITEVELKLSEDSQGEIPRITQMEFLGNGNSSENAVYIGTTEGLYRVSVANCERYGDCCACVSARDPHCAYDQDTETCVAVSGDASGSLVQSVGFGDISVCVKPTGNSTSTPQSPAHTTTGGIVATETTNGGLSTSTDVAMATPSPTGGPFVPPSVEGIRVSESSQNLWTIVGSVFGFIGGVVLGIIVMVFCYRNKGRFIWSKYLGSNRTPMEQQPRNHDKGAEPARPSGANNYSKSEDYERNNSEMNPHHNATAVVHVNPISNLRHSHGDKSGSKDLSPPPYSPTKPSSIPSNGASMTSSGVTSLGMMSSEKTSVHEQKQSENVAPPTHASHSTPEHKVNKAPPTPLTLSTPPKSTPSTSHTLSTPPKSTPLTLSTSLTLSTAPRSTTSLTLSSPITASGSTPSTPSQATPTHPPTHSTPTTPSQGQYQSKTPLYRRAYSHSYTPPQNGLYYTLPHKKRPTSTSHSQATPSRRPYSAEAPAAPFPRPASAQNLHSATSTPGRSMVGGTPTKHRPPHSPFSATPLRNGVPSSPYSGSPSAGTPASTCSGSSYGKPHFQFPPTKIPEGGTLKSPYGRSNGGPPLKLSRNPNVKATGVAVEPTTNHEMERYGINMAARMHTIDRKSKVPKGHSRSQPSPTVIPHTSHPHTTVVEIDGGLTGCTDC